MSLAGASLAYKKDGSRYYRSSITYKGKHISLGSFESETLAHRAYLDAFELTAATHLGPDDYREGAVLLPFEKWIVITNFRDNGLYIKTPIYLRKNYFDYYYSPTLVFKFDIDDLFYYSNHKIMKRGSHLFVAEYGLQTTILSRYGVKSFAVPGRDFEFINGDTTDFRYGNIGILNRYYGVTKEQRKGMPVYVTKIHVNGDYIIGRYPTEEEAAIAYNKAAESLSAAGFKKDFPENYIETIDEIDYARIYHMVRLSKKFRNFLESLKVK